MMIEMRTVAWIPPQEITEDELGNKQCEKEQRFKRLIGGVNE
jgi:hypothetical protein